MAQVEVRERFCKAAFRAELIVIDRPVLVLLALLSKSVRVSGCVACEQTGT